VTEIEVLTERIDKVEDSMMLMMKAMMQQNETIDKQNQFISSVEALLSPDQVNEPQIVLPRSN